MTDTGQEEPGVVDRSGGAALIRGVLGGIMAFVVFAMMALTTVDVTARYVFSAPVPGGFEIMQFMMALVIFTALPLVTWNGGHIVVSIFDGFFKGAVRYVQRLFALTVSAVAIAVICWRMWKQGDVLADGDQITGFLEWPIAPIAYAMSVLAAITLVIVLVLIWRHLRGEDIAARPADTEI